MKKFAYLLIPFLMGIVSTFSSAVTLKVATVSPDGSSWMKSMRAGAGEIENRTDGRVKIKFYTGGVMGNDRAVLKKYAFVSYMVGHSPQIVCRIFIMTASSILYR